MMLQSTGVLERKLEDEEKLLAEVQRDKDRYDQRDALERQVRLRHMFPWQAPHCKSRTGILQPHVRKDFASKTTVYTVCHPALLFDLLQLC